MRTGDGKPRAGICYAASADGVDLPVVDITGAPGLRPRGLADFGTLVEKAGWEIARMDSDPLYHVVTLKKARS